MTLLAKFVAFLSYKRRPKCNSPHGHSQENPHVPARLYASLTSESRDVTGENASISPDL